MCSLCFASEQAYRYYSFGEEETEELLEELQEVEAGTDDAEDKVKLDVRYNVLVGLSIPHCEMTESREIELNFVSSLFNFNLLMPLKFTRNLI